LRKRSFFNDIKTKGRRKNSDQASQISEEKKSEVMTRLNLLSLKEKEIIICEESIKTVKLQAIIKELNDIEVLGKDLPEDVNNMIEELKLNCLKKLDLAENNGEPDHPEQWDFSEIGKLSPNVESISIQDNSKFSSDPFFEDVPVGKPRSFLDSLNQMVIEEWGIKEKEEKKMINNKVRLLNRVETEQII